VSCCALPGPARGQRSKRPWLWSTQKNGSGRTFRSGTRSWKPALSSDHDAETGRFWRPIDPERGVYARNLAVLRRTPGIVLLLEGPCVNQTAEYQRLQGGEIEIDGQRYPERVRQYAQAILDGLRN
jgi:hypothetical protein